MSITFPTERVLYWLSGQPSQHASTILGKVLSPEESLRVYEELVDAGLIAKTKTLDESFDFLLTTKEAKRSIPIARLMSSN